MHKDKQRIVFFVGPDRCGKTEISKAVSRVLSVPYFKATSEHTSFLSTRISTSDQFLNQLRFADPRVLDILRQTGHSVIFDRGYPCEYAYSTVFGRQTDKVMLRHIDEAYASLDALIIFCHRSSYEGIYDDLDPSVGPELLKELHDNYVQFLMHSKCRTLFLNVDDENLQRQVDDILYFMGENTFFKKMKRSLKRFILMLK